MAKIDRFAIDEARKLQNLPPLTDVEFASLEGNGLSDEEKEAQLLEAKRKEDELKLQQEEDAKKKLLEEDKNKIIIPAPVEMSDSELLEQVSKRTGRSFSSFDDLKPTQQVIDKEKEVEEREADKLSWGLKTKKFKQKEYEAFIADSKNPKDLVYAQYRAEALKEDENLTDGQIESEFEEKYGLDQKPDSRQFKRGQKELNLLAENILRNNYANIYNLESDYSSFEKNQVTQKTLLQKIAEGTPAFNKAVDSAIAKLNKIKVKISDDEEYEVDASGSKDTLEKSLVTISERLRDKDFAASQIQKGYTPEAIAQIAWAMYLNDNFPTIGNEIKKQALLKHAAGTIGIPRLTINAGADNTEGLSEAAKVFVDIHKQANPEKAAVN